MPSKAYAGHAELSAASALVQEELIKIIEHDIATPDTALPLHEDNLDENYLSKAKKLLTRETPVLDDATHNEVMIMRRDALGTEKDKSPSTLLAQYQTLKKEVVNGGKRAVEEEPASPQGLRWLLYVSARLLEAWRRHTTN